MPATQIPPTIIVQNVHGQLDGTQVAELRQSYKPPESMMGMPVVWYERPTKQRGVFGICAKINRNGDTIDVFLPADAGYIRTGCRHVTDPMILGQGYDRTDGCWDYTDYYRRSVFGLAELEKRFGKLEKELANSALEKRIIDLEKAIEKLGSTSRSTSR